MKQKYTVKVAGLEINLVTEQPRESVEYIVSMIERRVREIMLVSPNCPRTECLILCGMEYCSEKLELAERVKKLESALGIGEDEEIVSETDKTQIDELEALRSKYSELEAQSALKAEEYEKEIDRLNIKVENLEEEKADRDGRELDAESGLLAEYEGKLSAIKNEYEDKLRTVKDEYEEKLRALESEKTALEEEIKKLRADAPTAVTAPEEKRPRVRSARTQRRESESQLSIDGGIQDPETKDGAQRRVRRKDSSFDLLNDEDV